MFICCYPWCQLLRYVSVPSFINPAMIPTPIFHTQRIWPPVNWLHFETLSENNYFLYNLHKHNTVEILKTSY